MDKKLHHLEIELNDREDYMKNQIREIEVKLAELDKIIRSTTSKDEGEKLIKERGGLQKQISRLEEELLKFKMDFRKLYQDQENLLISKRFIDKNLEIIFSLEFQII